MNSRGSFTHRGDWSEKRSGKVKFEKRLLAKAPVIRPKGKDEEKKIYKESRIKRV